MTEGPTRGKPPPNIDTFRRGNEQIVIVYNDDNKVVRATLRRASELVEETADADTVKRWMRSADRKAK